MKAVALLLAASLFADDKPAEEKPLTPELAKLAKGLKAKAPADRLKAVRDAAKLGDEAKPLARDLVRAMADPVAGVAQPASDAVKALRPDLHAHCLTLLVDKDPDRVKAAHAALAKLGAKAKAAVPAIAAGAVATPSLGKEAIDAIAAVSPGDEEATAAYLYLAKNDLVKVRVAAVEALAGVAAANPGRRKELYPVFLKALDDKEVRAAAVRGLGETGAAAKDVLPLLKQLQFDADAAVRKAAEEATEKVANPPRPKQ